MSDQSTLFWCGGGGGMLFCFGPNGDASLAAGEEWLRGAQGEQIRLKLSLVFTQSG